MSQSLEGQLFISGIHCLGSSPLPPLTEQKAPGESPGFQGQCGSLWSFPSVQRRGFGTVHLSRRLWRLEPPPPPPPERVATGLRSTNSLLCAKSLFSPSTAGQDLRAQWVPFSLRSQPEKRGVASIGGWLPRSGEAPANENLAFSGFKLELRLWDEDSSYFPLGGSAGVGARLRIGMDGRPPRSALRSFGPGGVTACWVSLLCPRFVQRSLET